MHPSHLISPTFPIFPATRLVIAHNLVYLLCMNTPSAKQSMFQIGA